MMGNNHSTYAAAALIAIAMLLAPDAHAGQMPPTPVRVAPVKREMVRQQVRVTGNLRATTTSAISAREEGRLIELLVREASVVKKGEVIARMDTRRLKAQLAEWKAELEVSTAGILERQAQLSMDRMEFKRLDEIKNPDAVSKQDVELAEAQVHISEAQVEQAKRRLDITKSKIDLVEVRLSDMEICAPFDGIVTQRHAEIGEWIRAGDLVVTMISSGPLEAWLNLPERLAQPDLTDTKRLGITMTASGRTYTSSALRVVPMVDARVRTFTLIATLDPGKDMLAAGMSITAYIPTGAQGEKTLVQKDALFKEATGFMVYKAQKGPDGSSMAVPVSVNVLFEAGAMACIRDGDLKPGDFVVVEGNERLRPMMPIAPQINGEAMAQGEPAPVEKVSNKEASKP